ncbi:hypothetical protein LX83_004354 [Goodfellowiella coeruleoviolacea]|uniref:Uncharacterized protein n=1 Tax=Goodfellowiella coeruleoviolacea TaxID=334858 RepID=A0AAE3KGP7_9PSEU|nr:hypothetical protein [Goodfellowiella coeruleoviolacea]
MAATVAESPARPRLRTPVWTVLIGLSRSCSAHEPHRARTGDAGSPRWVLFDASTSHGAAPVQWPHHIPVSPMWTPRCPGRGTRIGSAKLPRPGCSDSRTARAGTGWRWPNPGARARAARRARSREPGRPWSRRRSSAWRVTRSHPVLGPRSAHPRPARRPGDKRISGGPPGRCGHGCRTVLRHHLDWASSGVLPHPPPVNSAANPITPPTPEQRPPPEPVFYRFTSFDSPVPAHRVNRGARLTANSETRRVSFPRCPRQPRPEEPIAVRRPDLAPLAEMVRED